MLSYDSTVDCNPDKDLDSRVNLKVPPRFGKRNEVDIIRNFIGNNGDSRNINNKGFNVQY